VKYSNPFFICILILAQLHTDKPTRNKCFIITITTTTTMHIIIATGLWEAPKAHTTYITLPTPTPQ
jgi:hypothetical protein